MPAGDIILGAQLNPAAAGWADLLGTIHSRGVGATDPNWATYSAGIKQYEFAVNDEVWHEFHIPHDYVPGTDLYIHAHWSLNVGSISEDISWRFETCYAKGHNQAAFSTPSTISTGAVASSTTQYQHIISEVQLSTSGGGAGLLDTDDLEVDGVILCRTYLYANTGATAPFLHFVDIHYQTTGVMGTKNKAPDFYRG